MFCTSGDRTDGGCLQLEPRGLEHGISIALNHNDHHIARDNNDDPCTTSNDFGTPTHAADSGLLRSTAV